MSSCGLFPVSFPPQFLGGTLELECDYFLSVVFCRFFTFFRECLQLEVISFDSGVIQFCRFGFELSQEKKNGNRIGVSFITLGKYPSFMIPEV